MTQILVRQLDENAVGRLKKRAREHGHLLESEVRSILEEAVPDYEEAWKRIEKFHNRLRKSGRKFRDSAVLIRANHS